MKSRFIATSSLDSTIVVISIFKMEARPKMSRMRKNVSQQRQFSSAEAIEQLLDSDIEDEGTSSSEMSNVGDSEVDEDEFLVVDQCQHGTEPEPCERDSALCNDGVCRRTKLFSIKKFFPVVKMCETAFVTLWLYSD